MISKTSWLLRVSVIGDSGIIIEVDGETQRIELGRQSLSQPKSTIY